MASPCPCRGCTAAYKAGRQEGLREALDAAVRVDDKWSIATQNADTRELMQWCFRQFREAIDALRGGS